MAVRGGGLRDGREGDGARCLGQRQRGARAQWLRAEGCPRCRRTCREAVDPGHVETLRWARENGCPWEAGTRDWAAAELGYADDLGNLVVDDNGDTVQ